MSPTFTYEEYILDFTGNVAGVNGNRVICGSDSDVAAWLQANLAQAGQVIVYRRICSVTPIATYGLSVSPPPPSAPANAAIPAVAAANVNRVGAPNVPPGFKP